MGSYSSNIVLIILIIIKFNFILFYNIVLCSTINFFVLKFRPIQAGVGERSLILAFDDAAEDRVNRQLPYDWPSAH